MTLRGARALLLTLSALCVGGSASAFAASLDLASRALTPYRTCVVTATPSTTVSVIDASVRQGAPATNYGTVSTNHVASGTAANRRLYVHFNLAQCTPAIPSNASVRLATLRMYASGLPAVCRTIDIFRVTAAWVESGITWNNQPFGTAINSPARAAATDSFSIGTPVGCQNRSTNTYIVGATVTADVSAFIAGTATNYGWMLRDDAEDSTTLRTETFSAKNLGTASRAPQLVITYVTVP